MIAGGLLYFIMLVGLAYTFVQQLKHKPSTLENLQLQFVFFVFGVQLLQLITRVLILANRDHATIYNALIFIVSPLIDFGGSVLTVSFLIWSIFTQIWLQVKTNVIPQEFAHIL